MSAKQHLEATFDADKKLRDAEERFLTSEDPEALAALLERATEQALAMKDKREGTARLIRLADLCAQVQGPRAATALINILNHDEPQVRVAAGEALRDFAYDRYAEVARAIERAFESMAEGPALEELPWILAEIAEPSAVPLIGRALSHQNGDVVAAGIEALAELRDAAALALLKPLTTDKRVVQLEDNDASYSTTIGELAIEAIEEIED
jgi:HEAT repeat protein